MTSTTSTVTVSAGLAMGIGTAIAVYPHHGFWWAVAYGLVCEGWWAYRLSEWLLR